MWSVPWIHLTSSHTILSPKFSVRNRQLCRYVAHPWDDARVFSLMEHERSWFIEEFTKSTDSHAGKVEILKELRCANRFFSASCVVLPPQRQSSGKAYTKAPVIASLDTESTPRKSRSGKGNVHCLLSSSIYDILPKNYGLFWIQRQSVVRKTDE